MTEKMHFNIDSKAYISHHQKNIVCDHNLIQKKVFHQQNEPVRNEREYNVGSFV